MNINQILLSESGRLGEDIHSKVIHTDHWIRLTPKDTWPDEMGDELTAVTFERALPGTTPSWTDVRINTGSGNTGVPAAHVITPAQTKRTYNLQQVALESDALNVNDLRFQWKRQRQLSALMDNLTQNTRYLLQQRHRDEYVRIAEYKTIAKANLPSSTSAFPLEVPTSRLTQGILDWFYLQNVRDGAGEAAVEKKDGRPIFMVSLSAESQDQIFRDINATTGIREDFRYSSRANELLGPLGVERPYKGFFHLVDSFPPRYNFVGGAWVKVEPYVAEATTQGNRYVVNPAWVTASYEDTIIFHPHALKCLCPKPISNAGSGVTFDPQRYMGDWKWRNILDRVENPDGTWGYFRGVFQAATEPVHPEWAIAIRHLRCDISNLLLACPS